MRRLASCACALLLVVASPSAAAPEPLRLETAGRIDALKSADVDGDGLADLVLLSGRTVSVWTASRSAPPAAAPRWRVELPGHVSFVDVAREDRPSLLCLGQEGVFRLALSAEPGARPKPLEGTAPLRWHDGQKAVLASLHPGPAGDPTCVLPTLEGWTVRRSSGNAHVLAPWREVTAPGQFLEDSAQAKEGLPVLFTTGERLFWSLAGDRLTCLGGPSEVTYDLSFVPSGARTRVVDLDGDGTPEVATGEGDNREVRYAFFRVPPEGRDLRPPVAFLKLSGFNLEPDLVDLNADGLKDFVQTTIAVDDRNTMRAMSSGKVTATTLAVLQRKGGAGGSLFASQPDATVLSDIWVRVRFQHGGTIDVNRSFTILATGDLDGDGLKDLVIRVGPGTLAIRRGTAAGVWEAEPRTVEVPPLGAGEELEAHPVDLDGKPGDELLLLYRAREGQPDRLLWLR
jgi:hypothetical protein